jgi:hypothetical protein
VRSVNRWLLLALGLCWLSLPLSWAHALMSGPGDSGSATLEAGATGEPAGWLEARMASQGPSGGQLQLALGSTGKLDLAFPRLGRGGLEPLGLGGMPDAMATRNLEFTASWNLARSASLTSRQASVRNDRPDDRNFGLTSTDSDHAFVLGLGSSSRLQATIKQHSEAWDRALNKVDSERRTGAVELNTHFGRGDANDLRMALSSTYTKEGENAKAEGIGEVHLGLSPASRLKLTADYLAKSGAAGQAQRTQSAGATVELAPGSQLEATIKSLTAGAGSRSREVNLRVNAKLGGGSTAGQLTAEQTTVRASSSAGAKQVRSWEWTGGLGAGAGRTNLRAGMREDRDQGAAGRLGRTTVFHADRALWKRVLVSADREQALAGSEQQPEARTKSSYALAINPRPGTKLSARLETCRQAGGGMDSVQQAALEHEARRFRWRVQQQHWQEGMVKRSADQYALDAPRGQLPAWAENITRGHQFSDAEQYAMAKGPTWLDMPFAGLRLWAKQLRGGPDRGVHSIGWAERLMVRNRYHVQVAYQGHPEAEDGEAKGCPLPLRRELVEIAALLRGGLVAHGRYTGDDSLGGPPLHRRDVELGLRGRVSDQEQIEASISRENGKAGDKAQNRTSFTVMYALKVSDEQQVSLKGGLAWGEYASPNRECRVSLGYSKPI